MEKQLTIIPNRCTGCNHCVYACATVKEGLFMPSKARIQVTNFPLKGYSVSSICFQCPDAPCMKACPEGAIFKNERNILVVDVDECYGGGKCVDACPYGMIEQYDSGKAFKCDLCGGNPACADECHYGALVFKQPDKLLCKQRAAQMKQRIKEGAPDEKCYKLATNVLRDAVRVPQTTHYMG